MFHLLEKLKFRLPPVAWTIATTPIKVVFGLYGIMSAYFSAAKTGHKLPPGVLRDLRTQELLDRRYLLKLANKNGNIFKAVQSKRLIICVIGLERCRRLLSENSDNLRPESVSLTNLFPKGILRTLEGEDHRKYRQSLVRALDSSIYKQVAGRLPEIINHGLHNHAKAHQGRASAPEALTRTLDDIATGLLINIYFGAVFGSDEFNELMVYYRLLGPAGFVWAIGSEQKQSFESIRDFLRLHLSSSTGASNRLSAQSVIQRIHDDHNLDEVCMGNLIYMVEMGRFDLYSLFRWLVYYGGEHVEILNRIATEDFNRPVNKMTLSSAFVQETLRMDQSERLIRSVKNDFTFDGYLFPKTSYVRLCLWESHKNQAVFPEPFSFNPERFLNADFNIDQYAPFGLDQHRCPMADIVIQLSTLFIKLLADSYRIEPVVETAPNRGAYHWQPGKHFTAKLIERTTKNG